jgi:hypothetical protein
MILRELVSDAQKTGREAENAGIPGLSSQARMAVNSRKSVRNTLSARHKKFLDVPETPLHEPPFHLFTAPHKPKESP